MKERKTIPMAVRYLMNIVLVAAFLTALNLLVVNKTLSTYNAKVLMLVGVNIILAVSLNVATGYLGQLPLGHAGFMAVGAYASAIFTKNFDGRLPDEVNFVLGLVLAAVLAFGVGVLIGIPALRLQGDYLAILTLGFGEIIRITLNNIDNVLGFAVSAAFAGVAGGLYAGYLGVLNPGNFGFMKSIEILVMVVLGGMGSMLGSVLSATVLTVLPEALRSFSEYRMVVYALALVLMMIFKPSGLLGQYDFSLSRLVEKLINGELFQKKSKTEKEGE